MPIHKTDAFNTAEGVQTLAVDAKQRVVIFTQIPSWEVSGPNVDTAANKALIGKFQTVTCAEPSPDALSALSSSLGTSVSDAKVAANFALAQAESAASIGLRTQSIQLLRDGMYRLCEGYAGGAIDAPEFNRQQRRYQNLMLSLLAIEQLTGAVVPRQVALGGGAAGASVGENAGQAAADATAATKAVSDTQAALTTALATQAKDKKACDAASPDTTNASCTKAADDQAAVDDKTAALDTAKKKEETAKMVLQAARSAVTASATGAHAAFSDAPKTNSISDGSARYIAEATRTIVSTTLIASFAQEECSRLWDYLATPTQEKRDLLTALDGGGAETKLSIHELANNCHEGQQSLLNKAALYTPDYGAPTPPPLMVLGADTPIPLTAGGFEDLRIIGGTPKYEAVVTPALKSELVATVTAKGAVQTVHIERPKGASKTGPASVTIVDANNAHVEIPISLTKADTPKPTEAPKNGPTNVKGTAAGDGKITVTFVLPKDPELSKVTANGKDKTDSKAKDLSTQGKGTDTSIELANCVDAHSYQVSVTVVSSGKPITGNAADPVKCSGGAAPPPMTKEPTPTAPSDLPSPTMVTVKSGGNALVANFTAPKTPKTPVLGYTAMATNADPLKKSETPLPGKSTDNAPAVVIPNCVTGQSYNVSVKATYAAGTSAAAETPKSTPCTK